MAIEETGTLLTAYEVAERLRVPVDRVRRMIRNGELECIRLSQRGIRVDSTVLERWLAERTVNAKEPRS